MENNNLKKNLFVVLAVLFVLFLAGTFFDLNISNALYNKNEVVSCFFTIVGVYPFFSFNIYASSFVLGYEKVNKHSINVIKKIICIIIACVYILFIGGTLLTKDGVGMLYPDVEKKYQLAVILFGMLFLGVTTFIFGYSKGKKCLDYKKVNDIFYLLICLVAGHIIISTLKSSIDRPRYRVTLKNIPGVEYTAWYKRINDIETIVMNNGIDIEEIRSFPSGHGLCSGNCVAIFPLYFKNKKLGFISGVIYMFFVMMSRVILGAHYLSDVTFGAIISIVMCLVYLKIKD